VYSDFHTFNTHSIREMGRGLAVINYSPTTQLKLGVVYLDRNRIKLLPAGGNFLDSRSRHAVGNLLSAAESTPIASRPPARIKFGGTCWASTGGRGVDDPPPKRHRRRFRLQRHSHVDWSGMGARDEQTRRCAAIVEIGGAWDRELFYTKVPPIGDFELRNTFFLAAGVAY